MWLVDLACVAGEENLKLNTLIHSRNVALGLLVFSMLSLMVGVYNASATWHEPSKSSLTSNMHGRLALIDLSGMITMDAGNDKGFFQSETNAVVARKALDSAAKDNSVKGVLLHINSPGGTVGMSQELNAAVQRVSRKKPVVVTMGDLTASGGYYTACAADKIVANPGTLTASIGVIISTLNFSELMTQKLGVQAVTIKSGKFKDLLSPYRTPRPDEMALIQKLVNDSYQDFLNTVLQGRTRFMTAAAEKKTRETKIREIADGRVVTGRQALAAGLVDYIGDQDYAYTLLDKMAKDRFHLKGKERLPLKSEEKTFSLMEFLGIDAGGLQGVANPAAQAAHMLPLSMRYPNQTLWVME